MTHVRVWIHLLLIVSWIVTLVPFQTSLPIWPESIFIIVIPLSTHNLLICFDLFLNFSWPQHLHHNMFNTYLSSFISSAFMNPAQPFLMNSLGLSLLSSSPLSQFHLVFPSCHALIVGFIFSVSSSLPFVISCPTVLLRHSGSSSVTVSRLTAESNTLFRLQPPPSAPQGWKLSGAPSTFFLLCFFF